MSVDMDLESNWVEIDAWYQLRGKNSVNWDWGSFPVDHLLEDHVALAMQQVRDARRALARSFNQVVSNRLEYKILALFVDQNLKDGAASLASDGFFNLLNFPPPGCWLAYVENSSTIGLDSGPVLLALIPGEWIRFADRGVEVNPEECLVWLKVKV